MSAPVDVLAVMADVADRYENLLRECAEAGPDFRSLGSMRLREARAAVAELIAAARLAVGVGRVTDGLRAALANVQGSQP